MAHEVPSFRFTEDQKKSYRAEFAKNATDEQFQLFVSECERRRLMPGVDVVFQLRNSEEYDPRLGQRVKIQKVTLITTVKALRVIAQRTGQFNGYGKFIWYYQGEDLKMTESHIPRGLIPHAVSVEAYRKDWAHPVFAVARFDAYVQKVRDGTLTSMWKQRGEEQLAKCAEALALRMLAPEDCGDLYVAEEFERDQTEPSSQAAQAEADNLHNVLSFKENEEPLVPPPPMVAPAINQAPAEMNTVSQPAPIAFTAPPAPGLTTLTPGLSTLAEPKVDKVEAPAAATTVLTPEEAGLDPLPTIEEFNSFTKNRCAKLVRDVLPKGGVKDSEANVLLKNYLLKASGKADLKKITRKLWEQLLTLLESKSPEESAKIVKGA